MDENKTLVAKLPPNSLIRKRLEDLAPQLVNTKSEKEFDEEFGHDKKKTVCRRLRHALWNEYHYALSINRPVIDMSRIYGSVCSKFVWENVMKDDFYAEFILTQPHDLTIIQTDLIYEAYKEMEEILSLPNIDPKGNVNDKLVKTKVDILKNLEDRLNGSVVHRSQQYIEQNISNNGPSSNNIINHDEVANYRLEVERLKKELGINDVLEITNE